jgi:hypothetical protein
MVNMQMTQLFKLSQLGKINHKLAYEDALYTRVSHWSYELKNNQLENFSNPKRKLFPTKFWVEFT